MKQHPHHSALRAAVARAENNQSRFARDVGTTQQLVSYWLANGKALPAELVLATERAGYGGRHELRPDLYPLEEAQAA
jgi:DNA-binding transcriptional regulator YdaS (Cro superfamily)